MKLKNNMSKVIERVNPNLDLATKQGKRYQKILDAYNEYQSTIRHEGNPANRLSLWYGLCEEWDMTRDEFNQELRKAQEWEKKKDAERQKRDEKWFATQLKVWENSYKRNEFDEKGEINNDEFEGEDEVIKYIFDKEIDWGEIKDDAIEALYPLNDILCDTTKLERMLEAFKYFDYVKETKEILNEEIGEKDEEGWVIEKKWDEPETRDDLIKSLRTALLNILVEKLKSEIWGLLNKINEL